MDQEMTAGRWCADEEHDWQPGELWWEGFEITVRSCSRCRAVHPDDDKDGIHDYFGLSYANYLVLPRSHLQSMPPQWQWGFMALLEELDSVRQANGWDLPDAYRVRAVGADGRFTRDPAPHYNRGRTRLPLVDGRP